MIALLRQVADPGQRRCAVGGYAYSLVATEAMADLGSFVQDERRVGLPVHAAGPRRRSAEEF